MHENKNYCKLNNRKRALNLIYKTVNQFVKKYISNVECFSGLKKIYNFCH